MTFDDVKVGDRFSSKPNQRVFQKTGPSHAIDVTEGPDKDGFFFKDHWLRADAVVLRNDEPAVVYDPQKTKRD